MNPRPALQVIDGGRESGRAYLERLYRAYGGAVFGRCRYLLKEGALAEDALHDVFAKALLHEHTLKQHASALTWLLTIATNHCLNQLRAGKAQWRDEQTKLALVTGEGHGGVEALEARDTLRRALAQFDVETQRAVVHYYLDDLTLKEVADLLGRSVPTIRKRLERFATATGNALRDEGAAP